MSYESSLKAQRDYYSSIDFAKKIAAEKGFAEGIEKGIEKGIEEGIEKGMKKGMKKGMERGMEKGMEKGKIEEVKNLITKLGLSDKEAAQVADVTMAFVKRVRLQLKK